MTIHEGQCPVPVAPATLEESGISFDAVLQLVLKTLHMAGELTGTNLAARLGVDFAVIEPCLDLLRREQHCAIAGGAMSGPHSYTYRITDAGRVRAAIFLDRNHYVGPVPVPLAQYTAYMAEYEQNDPTNVTQASVRQALAHLVLGDRVLDQLGPAVAFRHSLFIYGPPGNGKTVISQAVRDMLSGNIAIPHALALNGSIIQFLDPVNHEQVHLTVRPERLERSRGWDHRWVPCRRPLVTVAGELTADALELGYSALAGFYHAPVQALANGGVLVVDDFGRQRATPAELLNRWISPLESGVDYFTLHTGQKFSLPFQTLVVFATNLQPADLVDEAFLRRVHYKVFLDPPTSEQFVQIFANYCGQRGVPFCRELAEQLLTTELRPRGVELRGCQPRDLIDHALSIAAYREQPRELTAELLSEACASYFLRKVGARAA